ncbi:unnamed protein product [Closterium sp. Naga37s-1]|nr:unnamed protein product [Closterium sp. Naga37s-1]
MALLARRPLFLASPSPSPTASNTRIPAPRPSLLRQHRLRLRICVAASSSSSPGDQKVAEQDESSLPPKESEVLSLKVRPAPCALPPRPLQPRNYAFSASFAHLRLTRLCRIADHIRLTRWRTVVACSLTISLLPMCSGAIACPTARNPNAARAGAQRRACRRASSVAVNRTAVPENHSSSAQPPALPPLPSPVPPSFPPLPPHSPHRLPPHSVSTAARVGATSSTAPSARHQRCRLPSSAGPWWRGQAAGARVSGGGGAGRRARSGGRARRDRRRRRRRLRCACCMCSGGVLAAVPGGLANKPPEGALHFPLLPALNLTRTFHFFSTPTTALLHSSHPTFPFLLPPASPPPSSTPPLPPLPMPSVRGERAAGLAVLGVVFATSLLGSLDSVPLAPEFMQTIGVVYCALVARQYFTKRKIAVAPTPLTAIQTLFPNTTSDADAEPEAPASRIPEGMGEGVQGRLRALEAERDVAVAAAGEMRRAGQEMARVVAEKEALEAVALQLADERDSAIAEVTALKTAVNAMTERMRAIEAMLASEVQRLQEQNLALETVALQLADERDSAIKQASELRSAFEAQREEDKRVLEMLAAQLIEERNAAVKEVQELKQVVAGLAEATGAGSGLTSEMEAFIRSRVRAVRAQFVDISKPYSQQEEAVNAFVAHLVDEFGAPREWTHCYIRQFLDAASDGHAIALNGPSPPSDHFN